MKGDELRREQGGWTFAINLPPAEEGVRDELIRVIIATVGGRGSPPLRCSRYAATFEVRLTGPDDRIVNLFIKVIAAPRGTERIKRRWRGSSAAHVARVTAELTTSGLLAPPVWVYGREPSSGREVIVTPRAEGRGPLRTLKLVRSMAEKRTLLRALGAEVARLHRSGFVHGDLTPFNLFVTPGEPARFVLLDHERTRRSSGPGRQRRQLRNLVQLGRFALPGINRTDRMRVLAAYAEGMGEHDRRTLLRRGSAMLTRRVRRDGGWQAVVSLPSRPIAPGESIDG